MQGVLKMSEERKAIHVYSCLILRFTNAMTGKGSTAKRGAQRPQLVQLAAQSEGIRSMRAPVKSA